MAPDNIEMGAVPVNAVPTATAAVTKAVVAKAVVLSPAVCVTPIVPVGKVGVPVKVGEADNTKLPVPVSSEITPANSAEVVAAITFNLSVVTTNVFEVGIVVLLILVAVATPKTGVTNVGEVANTATPDPVSSDNAVAKLADVNDPKVVAFPDDVIAPVKSALVTTVVAFPTEVTIPVKLALVAFAVVTADVTNSVVATWVVFVDAAAVGAKGVPVKVGLASGAFNASLPSIFCIACKIVSVAATVPAPAV